MIIQVAKFSNKRPFVVESSVTDNRVPKVLHALYGDFLRNYPIETNKSFALHEWDVTEESEKQVRWRASVGAGGEIKSEGPRYIVSVRDYFSGEQISSVSIPKELFG